MNSRKISSLLAHATKCRRLRTITTWAQLEAANLSSERKAWGDHRGCGKRTPQQRVAYHVRLRSHRLIRKHRPDIYVRIVQQRMAREIGHGMTWDQSMP